MSQEVVMVLGFPASGKTRTSERYVQKKYERLNRDTAGGKVSDLLPKLDVLLAAGKSVVMDNLFPNKLSRVGVLEVARRRGVPVRCVWVNTSLEDSQFNACTRMMERVGRIMDPMEKSDDPNLFPMAVIYKYRKEFDKPTVAEGFSAVEVEKFERVYPKEWTNIAYIFDYDGTLRDTLSGAKFPADPKDIKILPGRKEKLQKLKKDGYLLLGVSNQSGIDKGTLSRDRAVECFKETNRLLGVDIDVRFCPHKVPPISCYCRKPGTGLGVQLITEYNLHPKKCFFVGDLGTDKSFAERCGFWFIDQAEFFKEK